VSGLPADRFCVEGFLPRKGPERRRRMATLMADDRTTIVLEAPGRVGATLAELAAIGGQRPVAVVRELTKVHEEVWRGTALEGAERYTQQPPRGEVVLVIAGAPPAGPASLDDVEAAVRARVRDPSVVGEGPRQIADAVAGQLGVARRVVYELVLRLRSEEGDQLT
jgi:16S rRNA (cytidine1402-2'-O)-methyltransferase